MGFSLVVRLQIARHAAPSKERSANILSLHPASVYAGGAEGFLLRVDGSGFAAAAPGSVLLIGGTARPTTCSSAGECTAPVSAADVAAPGRVSVQVGNPNGTTSNGVSLIAAQPNISDEVITLTNAAPMAAGKDIVVVEATTAGVSVPGNDVDLHVAALEISRRRTTPVHRPEIRWRCSGQVAARQRRTFACFLKAGWTRG